MTPTVASYNVSSRACEKNQYREKPSMMLQEPLAPDIVSYNASFSQCETAMHGSLLLR